MRTIETALARTRAARSTWRAPRRAEVVVHAGTYRLTEPTVITPGDSGSPRAPLVIRAADGARPVFTGGRAIRGWRREGKLWVANAPWPFRQLFVNGRRRQRARSPNVGFHRVDGDIAPVWRWGPGGARLDAEPSRFRYRGSDIDPAWAASGDVEVVALQVWAESRLPIRAVDAATRSVTLAAACSPSNREANARYWVENARSALDAPGEWYLDVRRKRVYVVPLQGEDLAKAVVEAPATEQLVRLVGGPGRPVHDVEFRGITFRCAEYSMPRDGYVNVQSAFDLPAALTAEFAQRCALVDCRFGGTGSWALELGRACRGNRVDRCTFEDLGAGAVKLGEFVRRPDPADWAGGNRVERCRVRDVGRVFAGAAAVWIGQSSHNRIARSEVSDTWSTGISVGWSWGDEPSLARHNVIEANHLHGIGRGCFDELGGIYTLGAQPGTVLRGNVIHDIRSKAGWAIYLDEGSSGVTVERNVVYDTTAAGLTLHYGRYNVVRNNVFALSDHPNVLVIRETPPMSMTFTGNIVLGTGGLPLGGAWSGGTVRCDRNLYWTTAPVDMRFGEWTFAEWQARGMDAHSVVADPLFVGAKRGDFRVRPGSPALRMGYRPITLRDVGP